MAEAPAPDLVSRLRECLGGDDLPRRVLLRMEAAADEIERLTARVAELEQELHEAKLDADYQARADIAYQEYINDLAQGDK